MITTDRPAIRKEIINNENKIISKRENPESLTEMTLFYSLYTLEEYLSNLFLLE